MTTDHETGIENDQSDLPAFSVETDTDIPFSTTEFDLIYSQYKRAGYELAALFYQQNQLWTGAVYSH